jgi:adenosyl cobinamide kinase/adenosyl cobinamide phosphate guanylyltransferase
VDVVTTNGERAALTLVLGGIRSGKSEVAERLIADQAGPAAAVTYVATGSGPGDELDAAWAVRIETHRLRRPATWSTVEVGPGADLGEGIRDLDSPVLVDSLGTWVARFPGFDCDPDRLCADLLARSTRGLGPTVIVSEEVGLGVHPPTDLGVAFADALGTLNRRVASVAGRVLLVVAGRVLSLSDAGS